MQPMWAAEMEEIAAFLGEDDPASLIFEEWRACFEMADDRAAQRRLPARSATYSADRSSEISTLSRLSSDQVRRTAAMEGTDCSHPSLGGEQLFLFSFSMSRNLPAARACASSSWSRRLRAVRLATGDQEEMGAGLRSLLPPSLTSR